MVTSILNVAIAMIENRPREARHMMEELPLDECRHLSRLQGRLHNSVESVKQRAVAGELRSLLMETMKIHLPDENTEAFLEGVTAVEQILEKRLNEQCPEAASIGEVRTSTV